MLELRDLSFAYPAGRPLIEGLSFTFRSGGICAVLGPNGTGKTTLLKLLLGILKPSSGEMLLSGMPIGRMTAQRRARKLAYIPQDVSLRFPLSVFEFVLLGRKPWFVWGPSPSDVALTGTVLSRLDLDALAERPLANLSGGQRQKVALARALVQETDWLLLDEPTSSLDLRHQVEVLTTARRVATKQGKGVILSMHDINLAARYADTILLMKDGGIVASGAPADVLTGERIASVYGLPFLLARAEPDTGSAFAVSFSILQVHLFVEPGRPAAGQDRYAREHRHAEKQDRQLAQIGLGIHPV